MLFVGPAKLYSAQHIPGAMLAGPAARISSNPQKPTGRNAATAAFSRPSQARPLGVHFQVVGRPKWEIPE
jgi:hypothetical protein